MKQTKAITLSALLAALSVGILFIGGLLGIGTYAAPMLAGLCMIPAGAKFGRKYHLLGFITTTILTAILVRDVEEVLMYALLFGWYPIVRDSYQKLPSAIRLLAKILTSLFITLGIEALVMLVLVPETESWWIMVIFFICMVAVFLMYDMLIPKAEKLYWKYATKSGNKKAN